MLVYRAIETNRRILDCLQHLCQPKFLFCPTQYCRNRAVPTVRNSEYLNTIGSKLAPEIQVGSFMHLAFQIASCPVYSKLDAIVFSG